MALFQATPSRPARTLVDPNRGLRDQVSQRQLVMILIGVLLGMLLSAVDQTVVGTAMPRIIADLHGLTEYAWVTTSYLLASTVTVPIYGKLSDVYGRRPFFLLGMSLFLLGSALSGTSQNMTELILYRGIQGLGAGAMLPIVQAIIGDIFPPKERGRWQGLMMAVFGLATIVGPWAGGSITDNWGWRWVFYVNMPIGALALIFCTIALPSVYRKHEHEIDYIGALLLVVAAVPMLLGFSWAGNQYAWNDWHVLASFVVSALGWAAFVVKELRTREPIIAPRFFRNSIFTISVVTSFFVSFGMFGAIMFIPLFMQAVIGDSAANSGMQLTPMMLGFIASSLIGGQIMSRTGRYKWLAVSSLAVAVVGMFLLGQMDVHATNGLVIRDMVVTGLGLGVTLSLFTIVVQNAFPLREMGVVTATLQFFRSIGGTIGIAIFGSLLTSRFTQELPKHIPPTLHRLLPSTTLSTVSNPSVLLSPTAAHALTARFAAFGPAGRAMAAQLLFAVRDALAIATSEVFRLGSGLLLVAVLLACFLREIPLRTRFASEEGLGEHPLARRRLRLLLGILLGRLVLSDRQTLQPEKRHRLRLLALYLLRSALRQEPPPATWEPAKDSLSLVGEGQVR